MRYGKQGIQRVLWVLLVTLIATGVGAQDKNSLSTELVSYKKRELNSGLFFGFGKERESLQTDFSKFLEERSILKGGFKFEEKRWNLSDFMQEELSYSLNIGPYGSYGNLTDSTKIADIKADQHSFGLRAGANISYGNRYYYDTRNFTVFEVSGWGRYEFFRKNINGTSIDSLDIESELDQTETGDRFRFGFQARGGFGVGRLSPMNHLMIAHYLLEKYYPGRIFSDLEIAQFAQVIARIKHEREPGSNDKSLSEMQQLTEFLNRKMLLELPQLSLAEWQLGEFAPRYEGSRIEGGPFFKYYNREPDFIYGAYIKYDNARYKNVEWNRTFSAGLTYSRYKKPIAESEEISEPSLGGEHAFRDWMSAEVNLGWSYYSGLRSRFDFGVKYVPGIDLNGFNDPGPVSHNIVPYLAYYSQLNAKSRVQFDFSWRIADGEKFMVPGPELTLGFFRSRY